MTTRTYHSDVEVMSMVMGIDAVEFQDGTTFDIDETANYVFHRNGLYKLVCVAEGGELEHPRCYIDLPGHPPLELDVTWKANGSYMVHYPGNIALLGAMYLTLRWEPNVPGARETPALSDRGIPTD